MKKIFPILILIMFLNTMPAYANLIWPSVYISEGMMTWWIIIAGLVGEFIVLKIFTRDNYFKSMLMVVIMNIISTLVGIVAIPLTGLLGEIVLLPIDSLLNIGTFHISHWILSFLLTVLCNAVIESFSLKLIFKKVFKEIFLWIFCANIISVLLCALKISKIL
jgi:hypothetical protein